MDFLLVFLFMSGPPLSSLELRRDEAAGCLLYRSMGSPLSEKEAHDIQGPEVKNKPYKRWSEWECDVILPADSIVILYHDIIDKLV